MYKRHYMADENVPILIAMITAHIYKYTGNSICWVVWFKLVVISQYNRFITNFSCLSKKLLENVLLDNVSAQEMEKIFED